MLRSLLSASLAIALVAACTGAPDRGERPGGDTAAGAPAPADSAPADPASSDPLSEAEARGVLREVYRPLHDFYADTRPSEGGERLPPEAASTPAALRETLGRTMAPGVADAFVAQLLMEREGRYVVRPTERIITPFEGGPALRSVRVAREGDAFVITERYAETELYGRVVRESVVRRRAGGWVLVEVRRGAAAPDSATGASSPTRHGLAQGAAGVVRVRLPAGPYPWPG